MIKTVWRKWNREAITRAYRQAEDRHIARQLPGRKYSTACKYCIVSTYYFIDTYFGKPLFVLSDGHHLLTSQIQFPMLMWQSLGAKFGRQVVSHSEHSCLARQQRLTSKASTCYPETANRRSFSQCSHADDCYPARFRTFNR